MMRYLKVTHIILLNIFATNSLTHLQWKIWCILGKLERNDKTMSIHTHRAPIFLLWSSSSYSVVFYNWIKSLSCYITVFIFCSGMYKYMHLLNNAIKEKLFSFCYHIIFNINSLFLSRKFFKISLPFSYFFSFIHKKIDVLGPTCQCLK